MVKLMVKLMVNLHSVLGRPNNQRKCHFADGFGLTSDTQVGPASERFLSSKIIQNHWIDLSKDILLQKSHGKPHVSREEKTCVPLHFPLPPLPFGTKSPSVSHQFDPAKQRCNACVTRLVLGSTCRKKASPRGDLPPSVWRISTETSKITSQI